MATGDYLISRSLHIPLAAVGLLVYLGAVIVFVVGGTTLIFAGIGLIAGAPIGEIIDALSFSQIAADLTDDVFAWLAGILLCFALLPVFLSYNDWLGRLLYDQDQDIDSEG